MAKDQFLLAVISLAALAVAGCGNGLASVTGTVTLDGQPITGADKNGTVAFFHESGGGAPAVGIVDQTGRFTLNTGSSNGIEPGIYKVAIVINKLAPPVNRDALPVPTLITPEKYATPKNSGLRSEVKPGRNTIDFPLLSKGP